MNLEALPIEILEEIFAYVPTRDIDTLELVCHRWRAISGERLWKRQFGRQFATLQAAQLSTRENSWRSEFIMRAQILRKWKKCHKEIDVTVNSTLVDITDMQVNFVSENQCRALCFNSASGVGNLLDLQNGRIKLRFHCKHHDRSMPAACVDSSRFAILYGYYDGRVAIQHLHKDGTVLGDYEELKYIHPFAVSAAWLAKGRNINKHMRSATNYATGSHDGTLFISSKHGTAETRPCVSPCLLIEGTMYGTSSVVDGDYLVSLHRNGQLYRHKLIHEDDGGIHAESCLVATLDVELIEPMQMYLCNMFVIVQTLQGVRVVDLQTKQVHALIIPLRVTVTAFAVDTSHNPNRRMLVAGLSDDSIRVWILPDAKSASVESSSRENSVEPSKGKDNEFDDLEEEVDFCAPLWCLDNPTEQHLPGGSEKPPITQVAVNAAVALVSGYNGVVMAYDVLSGAPLKRVNSRISKNALDFSQYSRDGLVPVTHLYLDPNPFLLRGVIGVRPTVQAFDLGRVEAIKSSHNPAQHQTYGKKKPTKQKLPRIGTSYGQPNIQEELFFHHQISHDQQQDQERVEALIDEYGMDDLNADEQMRLAMLLSEQDPDAELTRALELSRIELESAEAIPSAPTTTEDDDMSLAIALSLQLNGE